MPVHTGEEPHEAALLKKFTAGALDRWAWNEIKAGAPDSVH